MIDKVNRENLRPNRSQGSTKVKNQGWENRQGRGKKENLGLDEKITRVGFPTPVLIITPGVLLGRQE